MKSSKSNYLRRLLKYSTDTLINPLKTIALILMSSGLIIGCGIGFIIVETLHCSAHILGAWEKYKSKEKSFAWMAGKVGLITGRLIGSIVGAVALILLASLSATPLFPILTCISITGFVAASIFSSSHKLRGLIDHLINGKQEDSEAFTKKRNRLISRAVIGLAGTALAIIVILKISIVMAILANLIVMGIGVAIFTGMGIWKAYTAYNEYVRPKYFVKNQNSENPLSERESNGADSECVLSTELEPNNAARSECTLSTPLEFHTAEFESSLSTELEPKRAESEYALSQQPTDKREHKYDSASGRFFALVEPQPEPPTASPANVFTVGQ
jgi:hypothetical protein